MHILAFILIFVVGSIIAACDGDYSGIAAIGKFVGFFVLLFAVLWLFTQPVLLIIAIVVLVLIVICCSAKVAHADKILKCTDIRTCKNEGTSLIWLFMVSYKRSF